MRIDQGLIYDAKTCLPSPWQTLAEGVFKLENSAKQLLIVSAGVHGDERGAQILVANWLAQLDIAKIKTDILVIFANIPAMVSNTRYIYTNLNRCFYDVLRAENCEQQRALELMQIIKQQDLYQQVRHFDCHNSIRPSLYPYFAILPSPQTEDEPFFTQLSKIGIQATVKMQQASHTFSFYSQAALGSLSATLELGDLQSSHELQSIFTTGLNQIAHGNHNEQALPPKAFEVIDQITRREQTEFSPDFYQSNFAQIKANSKLTNDYITNRDCAILFANDQVEIGHRAALLVQSKK